VSHKVKFTLSRNSKSNSRKYSTIISII